jgi:hypothetical protein
MEVYMALSELSIKRKSSEVFEFTFYRDSCAKDVEDEKVDIFRLMDEATIVLTNMLSKVEGNQLNSSSSVYRIKITAGGENA